MEPTENTWAANGSYLDTLISIGSEDSMIMISLIDMFKEQAPVLMNELRTTIDRGEAMKSKNTAHTLKGVCINLGLEPIATVCKSIEKSVLDNDFNNANLLLDELEQKYKEADLALSKLVAAYQ